jgi:DNA-directed RNA polymerase subunit RPC12/RpoP
MQSDTDTEKGVTLKEFLERVAPGTAAKIADFQAIPQYARLANTPTGYQVQLPEIELNCDSCSGMRFFKSDSLEADDLFYTGIVSYRCKNCGFEFKQYALRLILNKEDTLHQYRKNVVCKTGTAFKYGEDPAFGPPLPPQLVTLVRPQRELFFKGRRCESQGLGIGAFAYYRRVIEDQKAAIIDAIIEACNKANADSSLIAELTEAKNETQSDKAVSVIKHALPEGLLIKGHNPLTLIHNALSAGLHAHSDEECLEFATTIRLVMIDFAEKLAAFRKTQSDLDDAVTKLLQKKSGTAPRQ